jgi:hypothetical protein
VSFGLPEIHPGLQHIRIFDQLIFSSKISSPKIGTAVPIFFVLNQYSASMTVVLFSAMIEVAR